MDKLYVVTEFNTRELKKDEFIVGDYYIIIDGHKFYNSQIDDLTLFDLDVVIITADKDKVEYYKSEIRDFYDNYHRRH